MHRLKLPFPPNIFRLALGLLLFCLILTAVCTASSYPADTPPNFYDSVVQVVTILDASPDYVSTGNSETIIQDKYQAHLFRHRLNKDRPHLLHCTGAKLRQHCDAGGRHKILYLKASSSDRTYATLHLKSSEPRKTNLTV